MKKSKYQEVLKFGQNVKSLRLKKDWTQEQLAEASELNAKYIGFIERGTRSPSVKTIAKLYKALGCNPAKFFEGI